MKFKALPVTSLEDVTLDLEQLQGKDILDRTAENMLEAPSGAMTAQTRAMGTAYQPSTKRPTFVIVTFNCANSANDYAAVLMDSANPPTTEIGAAQGNATGASSGSVSFIVPPSFYYKFSAVVGAPTVRHTFEYAF